jgi:reversion-inducing cysteine-rich kazal motif protein
MLCSCVRFSDYPKLSSHHCHCNLQDKLWQCFLQSSESASGPATVEVSRIDRMGMDSAKLHCCSKAESPTCRRLCLKTFSNEWTRSWDEFDRECLSKLSEDSLFHCIDEGNVVIMCRQYVH